ncbi:hypothetical protein NDU88_001413 [Pleurodeles waltl]|uniref:Uncharacterized protein n=1 Tax=Pleurodeles waltl TaxID=8319 RepID=A0AAV7TIQ4_PLEWA|nr:hypothetical protein NDU88_001413 [Pleurodeles waltl]
MSRFFVPLLCGALPELRGIAARTQRLLFVGMPRDVRWSRGDLAPLRHQACRRPGAPTPQRYPRPVPAQAPLWNPPPRPTPGGRGGAGREKALRISACHRPRRPSAARRSPPLRSGTHTAPAEAGLSPHSVLLFSFGPHAAPGCSERRGRPASVCKPLPRQGAPWSPRVLTHSPPCWEQAASTSRYVPSSCRLGMIFICPVLGGSKASGVTPWL